MKNLRWKVILVLALTALAIYGIYPPQKKIRLGLDLKGGIHLVAEVKIDEALAGYTDRTIENLKGDFQSKGIRSGNIIRQGNTSFVISGLQPDQDENVRKIIENYHDWDLSITGTQAVANLRSTVIKTKSDQAVEQAVRIIRERVNQYGVTEPLVQREGLTGGRVIIQLPGAEDTERVKTLIEGTARLELKLVTGGPVPDQQSLLAATGGQLPPGQEIVPHREVRQDGSSYTEYFLIQKQAIISGEELQSAQRGTDQYGRPAVNFSLTSNAGEKFGRFTEANVGKRLAIVLDGKVQSAPSINSRITTSGIIEGSFTIEEANDLAVMLQSGALPAGLRFLEQRVIGPSLGQDSIRKGLTACLVSAALIIAFMLFYYKLSGVNAVLALILNMLFLLAFMSYFAATLTLPGIAGIVLSIGIAVDANVLIFERIKEDLRMGKTVRSALDNGFKKAFYPIFDAHVTAIISSLFLFWFGSGPIRGFAVTLITGIISSLFTAIWVSKLIFELVLRRKRKVESISI